MKKVLSTKIEQITLPGPLRRPTSQSRAFKISETKMCLRRQWLSEKMRRRRQHAWWKCRTITVRWCRMWLVRKDLISMRRHCTNHRNWSIRKLRRSRERRKSLFWCRSDARSSQAQRPKNKIRRMSSSMAWALMLSTMTKRARPKW